MSEDFDGGRISHIAALLCQTWIINYWTFSVSEGSYVHGIDARLRTEGKWKLQTFLLQRRDQYLPKEVACSASSCAKFFIINHAALLVQSEHRYQLRNFFVLLQLTIEQLRLTQCSDCRSIQNELGPMGMLGETA